MHTGRAFADEQVLGDASVGEPLDQERQDLALARGQAVVVGRRPLDGRAGLVGLRPQASGIDRQKIDPGPPRERLDPAHEWLRSESGRMRRGIAQRLDRLAADGLRAKERFGQPIARVGPSPRVCRAVGGVDGDAPERHVGLARRPARFGRPERRIGGERAPERAGAVGAGGPAPQRVGVGRRGRRGRRSRRRVPGCAGDLSPIRLRPSRQGGQLGLVIAVAGPVEPLETIPCGGRRLVDASGRQEELDQPDVHRSGELRLMERFDQLPTFVEQPFRLRRAAQPCVQGAHDGDHAQPVHAFPLAGQQRIDHALGLSPTSQLHCGIDRIAGDEPTVPPGSADPRRPRDAIHGDLQALLGCPTDEQRRTQIGEPAPDVVDVIGLPGDLEALADRRQTFGTTAAERRGRPQRVERMTLGQARPGRPRLLDRCPCRLDGFGVVAAEHPGVGDGRKDAGTDRRSAGAAEGSGRGVEQRRCFVHPTRHPGRPGQPLVGGRPALQLGLPIEPLDGGSGHVPGAVVAAARHRRERALVIQPGDVPVGRPVIGRDGIPQADGPFVGLGGLGEGVRGRGRSCGTHPRAKRAHWLVGSGRMVREGGQLARALRARTDRTGVERRRVCRMQPAPLAGQQVVVHGLGQQGVSEAVGIRAALRIDHQDLGRQGLTERCLDVGLGRVSHLRKHLGLDGTPRDRSHPEDPLGVLGQGGDAGHQDVAQRRRDDVTWRPGTAREELFDEERVAFGSAFDRLEQVDGRAVSEDGRDLGVKVDPTEPLDLDPVHPRQTIHLRQPRPQRVPTAQLIGPIRADHGEPLGPRIPGEERQDVTRGAVRPMQVLDHEHDRHPLPEGTQQRQEPLEDAPLDPRRAVECVGFGDARPAQFREQSTQVGSLPGAQFVDAPDAGHLAGSDQRGEPPQRLDDRCEREPFAVAERHAPALENEPAVRPRVAGDLVDKACLADPRIAAHQGDDGVPARPTVDGVDERSQLPSTPDEFGARDPCGHRFHGTGAREMLDGRRATIKVVDQAAVPAVPARRRSSVDRRRWGRSGAAVGAAELCGVSSAKRRAFDSARRIVSACWLNLNSKSAIIAVVPFHRFGDVITVRGRSSFAIVCPADIDGSRPFISAMVGQGTL